MGNPTKRTAPRDPAGGAVNPSDRDLRVAAILAVVREQLTMFEQSACAGSTLALDPDGPQPRERLLPGVSPEQVIARSLATGATPREIAIALGLPGIVVREAVEQLACVAHVDWTPRGGVPRKAVA